VVFGFQLVKTSQPRGERDCKADRFNIVVFPVLVFSGYQRPARFAPFQNATSASFGTPADSPVVLHRVTSSVEAGTEPHFNRPASAEQAQTRVPQGIQADWSAIWK
jgi:hypothetical protein